MTLKETLGQASQSALRDKLRKKLESFEDPIAEQHGMQHFEKIKRQAFKKALDDGSFKFDDSKLIEAKEAPAEVLNLCDEKMPERIENAKKYR